MMLPASCFGNFFCPRDVITHSQSEDGGKEDAGLPRSAGASSGLSVSSVTNADENSKQQCKTAEVFQCGSQGGDSNMSPFRSGCVSTKRSRDSSQVKLEIESEDSDECELDIDVPSEAASKKARINKSCTNGNRDKEPADVTCAEKLHDSALPDILGFTEESEKIIILWENSKSLSQSEKLGNISPEADKTFLPDLDTTDILKILGERDPVAYSKEEGVFSAASIEAGVQKEILKQGSAETSMLAKELVQEHANEDYVGSGRVTQSVLCTSHFSKDETTVGRPYKEIINIEESQSLEDDGGNGSPEDTCSYPAYYLNMKESEITLSSSNEETEPSGEDTEMSESDDPLEECRRIFDEFEKEAQEKDCDKQAHGRSVELNLLETKVSGPEQNRRIAQAAKFDVHGKDEVVIFEASPLQQGHSAEILQAHWDFEAAVEGGQTFFATICEQMETTPGLSAAQFQSIGPIDLAQPIETNTGELPILLEGNVAIPIPFGLSVSSFEGTSFVPFKVSAQKNPSVQESGSKVPLETRQRYVGFFFTECFKICSTVSEAFDKAVMEEQSIYDRCGSKNMYLNFAVKTLKKLRDHGQLPTSRSSSGAGSIKSEDKAFTGSALYELLKDYVLSEEQLNENSFPQPNPEKNGSAVIPGIVKDPGNDAFKRVCCRCGEVYAVTSSGEHRRNEECNYHSGRVLEQKVLGGTEKCYSCCERIVGSAGCQIAKLHVHDGRREKLEGFMKTHVKSPPSNGTYGIYALDCEKCYTTRGLELTRVTVVDDKLQVIYDTLVKPDGEVVDYDLRLSGVTEDDMKNTTTSLQSVQTVLLNLFSADTILIGHDLGKSLIALKLFHDKVVDTSVVFPHRLGLPHKRELRSLTAEYLMRIHQDDVGVGLGVHFKGFLVPTVPELQQLRLLEEKCDACRLHFFEQLMAAAEGWNGKAEHPFMDWKANVNGNFFLMKVGGHNSREAAVACVELILWKVKEDNKGRKQLLL